MTYLAMLWPATLCAFQVYLAVNNDIACSILEESPFISPTSRYTRDTSFVVWEQSAIISSLP